MDKIFEQYLKDMESGTLNEQILSRIIRAFQWKENTGNENLKHAIEFEMRRKKKHDNN